MWGDPLDCKTHEGRCEKKWPIGEQPDGAGYYYSLDGCPARNLWPSTRKLLSSRLMDLAIRYRTADPSVLFGGSARNWPLNWCVFVSEVRAELELISEVRHARVMQESSARRFKQHTVN